MCAAEDCREARKRASKRDDMLCISEHEKVEIDAINGVSITRGIHLSPIPKPDHLISARMHDSALRILDPHSSMSDFPDSFSEQCTKLCGVCGQKHGEWQWCTAQHTDTDGPRRETIRCLFHSRRHGREAVHSLSDALTESRVHADVGTCADAHFAACVRDSATHVRARAQYVAIHAALEVGVCKRLPHAPGGYSVRLVHREQTRGGHRGTVVGMHPHDARVRQQHLLVRGQTRTLAGQHDRAPLRHVRIPRVSQRQPRRRGQKVP